MVFAVDCKVKLDNSGLKEVLKACEEFKKSIKVGYLTDSELAHKAAINHLGTYATGEQGVFEDGEKIDIPARPFITHAIDEYKETIKNAGNTFLEAGFTKNNAKEKMITVAQYARDAIKLSIEEASSWSYPSHNSPRTIERKGFDRPLIDTGAMRDGVEYSIGE